MFGRRCRHPERLACDKIPSARHAVGLSVSSVALRLFAIGLDESAPMGFKIRNALTRDIPHLAYILLEATGGVVEALYEGAIPGRRTNEIVEHLFSRSGTTMCFSNAIIAEEGDAVLGGLHAYPVEAQAHDPADPLIAEDRLSVIKPFGELHCTGGYYIVAVALYPEARNKGIAKRLLQQAESNAKNQGFEQISLHVFEQNNVARSLYTRIGYQEQARRPVVAHPRIKYGGDIVLMTKSL